LTDLFREFLSGPADAPALVYGGTELTFGALRQQVRTMSATLFGDSAKRLALCFLPNSPDLALTYLSAVTAGHAVGLLPPATPASRKRRIVESYRPDVVAADDQELAGFLEGRGYRPLATLPGGAQAWTGRPAEDLHPDLALLLSTSGSTGTPKLVRLSASNIAANAGGIVSSLGITPARRAVTSMPLCYSFGLSVLGSHLAADSAVVVTDRSPVTAGFWDLVRQHRVTDVAGTPMIHRAILRRQPNQGLPTSVRVLTQAGGRLPEELGRAALAWAQASDGSFFCMYGQTEATARISCLDASQLADRLGSVGTALPGGRISVGAPLPGADSGPISYCGPNVMMGYATCRDDLSRGAEVHTLETGDLGRLDADGFLYVTGRSSRYAKVLDRRVSLDDVEEWFGVPGSCAAVTAPGDDAVIVIFTTRALQDLEGPSRELIASIGAPRSTLRLRPVAAIPLTLSGKVDYAQLQHKAGSLSGAMSASR
jgi:acyl-CoA synthetase (AMP-forming)/AMP-acid ligase II